MIILRINKKNFLNLVKNFSSTPPSYKENLKNAKKFKSSSQQWLSRQINDIYVKEAKYQHYRCRSAFKLLEINHSYKILKPGQAVVDLGCAPGSWTQVAVKATKATNPSSKSVVVGVDLSTVHPVEGARLLSLMDFTTENAQERVQQELKGRNVDVVLSDMAPSASGIKSMDHTNIVKLCYTALRFAEKTSSPGGCLVMKVFFGEECKRLKTDALSHYEAVRIFRPESSRKESSEVFFVCLNFKSDQRTNKDSVKDLETVKDLSEHDKSGVR